MICTRFHLLVRGLIVLAILFALAGSARADGPIPVGSRRELFVDHYLIERLDDARLELHRPQAREVAIVHDQPQAGQPFTPEAGQRIAGADNRF